MKHKKFVKQIMSTGKDRNTAEFLAQLCQYHRQPYAKAWEDYKGIKTKKPGLWFFAFLGTLPTTPREVLTNE